MVIFYPYGKWGKKIQNVINPGLQKLGLAPIVFTKFKDFELELENGGIRTLVYLDEGSDSPECQYGQILECKIPFQIFNGHEGVDLKIKFVVKRSHFEGVFVLLVKEKNLHLHRFSCKR